MYIHISQQNAKFSAPLRRPSIHAGCAGSRPEPPGWRRAGARKSRDGGAAGATAANSQWTGGENHGKSMGNPWENGDFTVEICGCGKS